MLWVTDGSWEEAIIAGEGGVGARRAAVAITRESTGERLVEKDQKERGRYSVCAVGRSRGTGRVRGRRGMESDLCELCKPQLTSVCFPLHPSRESTALHKAALGVMLKDSFVWAG